MCFFVTFSDAQPPISIQWVKSIIFQFPENLYENDNTFLIVMNQMMPTPKVIRFENRERICYGSGAACFCETNLPSTFPAWFIKLLKSYPLHLTSSVVDRVGASYKSIPPAVPVTQYSVENNVVQKRPASRLLASRRIAGILHGAFWTKLRYAINLKSCVTFP